jgi:voltage-gated potassium channel
MLDGQKIKDAGIRSELNVIIVAITPAEGEMIFNPNGEQLLRAGDMLIAIGTRSGLTRLAQIAAKRGNTDKL